METGKIPKWQKEVERILKEQFPGDEYSKSVKEACEVIDLVKTMVPPSGDLGKVLAVILKNASKELPPLTATYTGFQLGVAYERYQNANRIRKP